MIYNDSFWILVSFNFVFVSSRDIWESLADCNKVSLALVASITAYWALAHSAWAFRDSTLAFSNSLAMKSIIPQVLVAIQLVEYGRMYEVSRIEVLTPKRSSFFLHRKESEVALNGGRTNNWHWLHSWPFLRPFTLRTRVFPLSGTQADGRGKRNLVIFDVVLILPFSLSTWVIKLGHNS